MSRVLIALVARTPSGLASTRLDLADRVDQLRMTSDLACEKELLDTLGAVLTTQLAARAWPVVADATARTRRERWLEDVTVPRAYCTVEGAIMVSIGS